MSFGHADAYPHARLFAVKTVERSHPLDTKSDGSVSISEEVYSVCPHHIDAVTPRHNCHVIAPCPLAVVVFKVAAHLAQTRIIGKPP